MGQCRRECRESNKQVFKWADESKTRFSAEKRSRISVHISKGGQYRQEEGYKRCIIFFIFLVKEKHKCYKTGHQSNINSIPNHAAD